MNKNTINLSLIFLFFSAMSNAQELDKNKHYAVSCIAFYNFENLFDTLDTENVRDTEFTPLGDKQWNTQKYYEKLDHMAMVVSQLGIEVNPDGPAILGVAEIENRSVLEDFVKTEKVSARNYQIVHYDSPDKRGVDVAMLYNPRYFKELSSKSYTLKIEGDTNFFTRDQLLVTGELHGERVHVMVSHWPSRRGGEKRSGPKRMAAAQLGKSVVDSILAAEPNAKIFYMGDLNDDPVNKSLKNGMNSKGNKKDMDNTSMYNPMEDYYKKGIGTLAWKDSWNLFDQILISNELIKEDLSSYCYYSVKIFNKDFLKQQSGNFAGYPYRTYVGSNYAGGYSDHFPSYIFVVKEIK